MRKKKLILTYGASNELRRMGFENEGYIDYEIYKKYSEELVYIFTFNFCLFKNIIGLPHEISCVNCPFSSSSCCVLDDCFEEELKKFFESEV